MNLVNFSLLLTASSSWLARTLLVAEFPFKEAKGSVLPTFFAPENKVHAPTLTLSIVNLVMGLALIMVLFANDALSRLIGIMGVTILPSFHTAETTIGPDIAKRFGPSEMDVTEEVFESHASIFFDQAENHSHTIKESLLVILGRTS